MSEIKKPPRHWQVILQVTDRPLAGEPYTSRALLLDQVGLGGQRAAGVDVEVVAVVMLAEPMEDRRKHD